MLSSTVTSLTFYEPEGRVSKESFEKKILEKCLSGKFEYENIWGKEIIHQAVDKFFKLPELSYLNLEKPICSRPIWSNVLFNVNILFNNWMKDYLPNLKIAYLKKIVVKYNSLNKDGNEIINQKNIHLILTLITDDLVSVISLNDLIERIGICFQFKFIFINELYKDCLKSKPDDIENIEGYKKICRQIVDNIGKVFFDSPFMSYFPYTSGKTKKEKFDVMYDVFNRWLSKYYLFEESTKYLKKMTTQYDSLIKKFPQIISKEDINEILNLHKNDLEQVSSLRDFIVEVNHCEETFAVYSEKKEVELELLENKEEHKNDRLTEMKRRRDKRNNKLGLVCRTSNEKFVDLTESEESKKAMSELIADENFQDKRNLTKFKQKLKKKKRKEIKRKEQQLQICLSKWMSLSHKFFDKQFLQKLIENRKKVLQNIERENFEASVIIQKKYRKHYYSRNWSKIKISVNMIQQRVRIFLSQRRRIYLQKILLIRKIFKKYMKPHNFLKKFFQIFKDKLRAYYKGFSIGERVVLVESTRIREREHKHYGIIDSINSNRIRERKNPLFVTGKTRSGGTYQSNKTVCKCEV